MVLVVALVGCGSSATDVIDAGRDVAVDARVEDAQTTDAPGDAAPDAPSDAGRDAGPACGDGVIDEGEACDDGNDLDADGCEADCTLPACGNGIVDPGELCLGAPSIVDVRDPGDGALADLDHDGVLELLASEYDPSRIVLVRVVDGAPTAERFEGGLGPSRITVGRITADLAAMAWIDTRTPQISVRPLAASGPAEPITTLRLTGNAHALDAADLDDDGDDDLAALVHPFPSQPYVALFRNDGGTLTDAPGLVLADRVPSDLIVADLEGDGAPEIVVLLKDSFDTPSMLATFRGSGASSAATWTRTDSPVLPWADRIASGDVDGDGDLDLVLSGASGYQLVRANEGALDVGEIETIPGSVRIVTLGDVDHDGDVDRVAHWEDSSLHIDRNDGTGLFVPDPPLVGVGSVPRAILIGDVNGDLAHDVITMVAGSDAIVLLLSNP
ncbi:hypothetical protein DB32_003920 [Sandaracinus amylolyticus]|uniref:Uncharacterized protein n=2 Tax=Sandaracinus amylolyticus TaxID=927083 RepID=A0A0F6W433_9BACT|nr:hypothetical protein DB32_003920 [Sandaracinus amylolyticus]